MRKVASKEEKLSPLGNYEEGMNWNPVEKSLELIHPENEQKIIIEKKKKIFPVFFENRDYVFDVEFKKEIKNPFVYSKLKEISERFYYRENRNVLAGTVNFGNDICKGDFLVNYIKDEKLKQFEFQFEVFPTKLDFKNDYRQILMDIEQEYPFLVLDFLKKTYASFKSGAKKNGLFP